MLPTSFSLRLYCGEPAHAPSCISFALLLVDAPHLVLSAVVLQTACSRSLAHFLRAPPGPHVPCTLPSRSPRSMAPHWFSPCYTARACSRSPPGSLCGCTADSLLVLPRALPSRSSWSSCSLRSSLALPSVDGSSLVLSVLYCESLLVLPTWFSLRLYCGQPARAPSRTSLALLLVLTFLALFPHAPLGRWLLTGSLHVILREPACAPHLVLSAVVLRTACSRSLAHFPRAPPGPHVPCALPSHSPWSMAPHWFSPCYTVRACSRSPSRSSIFTPLLARLPRTPPGDTCTCEAYIYIICVRQSLFTSCFPPLPIHLSLRHRLTAHIPCTRRFGWSQLPRSGGRPGWPSMAVDIPTRWAPRVCRSRKQTCFWP